jgi:hypothetical protein
VFRLTFWGQSNGKSGQRHAFVGWRRMKPEVMKEIVSVCEVLTLAGLQPNPYPMVDRRQELKWERAGRAEILSFVRKNYGWRAAQEAARLKLFTVH